MKFSKRNLEYPFTIGATSFWPEEYKECLCIDVTNKEVRSL